MNRSTTLALSLFAGLSFLVSLPVDLRPAEQAARAPRYVGTQVCAGCHQEQSNAWQGSHHALAWTLPGDGTVLGDFDATTFEHRGQKLRFSRRDGGYSVRVEEPTGTVRDYEVAGVAGISPLQQYLVETVAGRLQALDVAWDVGGSRWYDLYPDAALQPGDGLHWRGPYKTWNARCAECHATGFEKNYVPQKRRYHSRQAETGVGCEACHGPGEAHAAWAEEPDTYDAARWADLTGKGFTIGFSPTAPETEIQLCAGCHSRREPLFDDSPVPGTPFHDAYRLALLRPGLYHADGSIQEEVYVYGSFLQSKMFARGVRCSDCHEPHAAKLKATGNAVCTQCHSPAGNPRFPILSKKTYDDAFHHFHAAGSEGAQCTSCHMIERVYMGIDGRRDHSFRIPRPDLSVATGAPNACMDCHAEQGSSWAAAEIARHFPDAARRGPHFGQVFAAAREEPAAQGDALLAIAGQAELPGIVRATALDLLVVTANHEIAAQAAALLADMDSLVRAAAIAVQRGAPPDLRVQRLAPMLRDPMRTVRIAAAREFLAVQVTNLPSDSAAALEGAMREWRQTLLAKADYPETHVVIGGISLVTRNLKAAKRAFRAAVELDPQLVDAWVMIVRILAAEGDEVGARAVLDDAISANPSDELLIELLDQLGPPREP